MKPLFWQQVDGDHEAEIFLFYPCTLSFENADTVLPQYDAYPLAQ